MIFNPRIQTMFYFSHKITSSTRVFLNWICYCNFMIFIYYQMSTCVEERKKISLKIGTLALTLKGTWDKSIFKSPQLLGS